MANNILSQGQALSLVSWSGSHNMASQAIFVDPRDSAAHQTVRVQGFRWTGASTLTIKDSNGTTLFNRTTTSGRIWPNGASGSYGLVCTTPFYLTSSGLASQGGILTVYGEVM